MAQTIILKRSAVPGNIPTTAQLNLGELALNTADGVLYYKKDDGVETVVAVPVAGNNISIFTNDSGFITGIISTDVTTALGYTPQDSATAFSGDYNDLINQPSIPTATSDLTNDSGYITIGDIPADAVTSVAGKTGTVTLVKADITDFVDSDYATGAEGDLATSAVQPGDNISVLVNDSGFISDISSNNIEQLANVDTTGVSTNDVLSFNGTEWVASTPSGGSSVIAGNGIDITSDVISIDPKLTDVIVNTWDPAIENTTSYVISNGNLTATLPTGSYAVVNSINTVSGKNIFIVSFDDLTNPAYDFALQVGGASQSTDEFQRRSANDFYVRNISVSFTNGADFTDGDHLVLAIDTTTRQMWAGIILASQGGNTIEWADGVTTANVEAGTNQHGTWTSGSDYFFKAEAYPLMALTILTDYSAITNVPSNFTVNGNQTVSYDSYLAFDENNNVFVDLTNVGGVNEKYTTTEIINCETHNISVLTAGTLTIGFANIPLGVAFSCSVYLISNGTPSVTWPAGTKWNGGAAPTLSTNSGDVDLVTFLTTNGGVTWLASHGSFS